MSSSHPLEVPSEEEEILSYFLEVRSFLSKMKQNRSQFLNSKDVMDSYQKVLTKVRELDELRKHSHATPSNSATTLIHSAKLHNRVDSVIAVSYTHLDVYKRQVQDGCGFCSELSTCVCRELEEDTKRGGCTGEPGTCSICQQDNGSKNFCENVVNFARSSSSSSLNNDEYIPINDAFQRIKKHMKNSNNQSLNNIRYDNLAIKGRKVQLKSVMDIIQDMNKNFI